MKKILGTLVMAGLVLWGGMCVHRALDVVQAPFAHLQLAPSLAGSHYTVGPYTVTLTGAPLSGLDLSATARHPLGHQPDQRLTFERQSDGSFVSRAPLPAGRWRLRHRLRRSRAIDTGVRRRCPIHTQIVPHVEIQLVNAKTEVTYEYM